MPRTSKKKRRSETLAEQHRRLVQPGQEGSDGAWLEQPEPVLDTTTMRFVTTYGTSEDPAWLTR